MEDNLWWKTTIDWRWPLKEDDHWLKMTFEGRRPLMEEDLCWKTTFDGRWPLVEENLWWKTYLWWKTTFERKTAFDWRQALMKTTFDGRWFCFVGVDTRAQLWIQLCLDLAGSINFFIQKKIWLQVFFTPKKLLDRKIKFYLNKIYFFQNIFFGSKPILT